MFWFVVTTAFLHGPSPRDSVGTEPRKLAMAQPGAPDQATRTDLEGRVAALEREVERLRLQQGEAGAEGAPPPAAPSAVSPNVFNPTVTVIGNGLYRYDDRDIVENDSHLDNQFNLRETELDFRAAVDPFADAVAITAIESEIPGEFAIGVEEAYVQIKRLPLPVLDQPPLGLKLKAGRFRTEMGRLNRVHLHDLPQMTRPLVTTEFLGEEGYIGDGLSAQFFLPTPFDAAAALELTLQALTGGGVPVADGPPDDPAFVGNLRWFRAVGGAHNFDLSLIADYGSTAPGSDLDATTLSADFLYRWKPLRGGEFKSFLLGGQGFWAQRDFLATDGGGAPLARRTEPRGWFAFVQFQPRRTTYLGLRWDDTDSIDDDSVRRQAVTGYMTWYTSEFLRFRFGYEHRWSDLSEEDGRDSAYAELNFVFGAHPIEPFWVNR